MKKIFLTLISAVLLTTASFAQRIAVVDVTSLLEKMSEYENAQTEIDNISAEWRQDISKDYDKIKSMYNKYQAEQVLLSDEVRKQREDEIMEFEKAVREKQKQRFGPEGDLFRKRQEMVRPIQDKVFAAIDSYAAERGYDLIFDKSGAAGLLFASQEFDKTEDIRRKL
jgi:outer membrane protein